MTVPLALPVCREGRVVPSVIWPASSKEPAPVVLLGHGGSGTKTSPRHQRLATWFVSQGFAAVAIDGPFHGDRVDQPMEPATYQSRMVEIGVTAVIEGIARDWEAALNAATDQDLVDPNHVAYFGLSMGSRFGIPLAATLGAQLRCAVFGKFGLEQSPLMTAGLNTPQQIAASAAAITSPILMHMQWDDELFPRVGALALFDAFAANDKTLIARAGPHGAAHPDNESLWREFIATHLRS